jgi:glutamate racemase
MFEILEIPRANLIEMVGPTVSSFKGTQARILVLATHATVESGVYQEGFRMIGIEAEGVALPRLVGLIEEGATTDLMVDMVVDVLAPYAARPFTHVLLGCTHYPLVVQVFEAALTRVGMDVVITDPAHAVAAAALRRFDVSGTGTTRFLLSRESDLFQRYAPCSPGDTGCTFTPA